MDRIQATLKGIGSIAGILSGSGQMSAGLTVPSVVETPLFTGEYEYTPGSAEQIIEIAGLRAGNNITINPIPQNYGLITWNGSTLTVS